MKAQKPNLKIGQLPDDVQQIPKSNYVEYIYEKDSEVQINKTTLELGRTHHHVKPPKKAKARVSKERIFNAKKQGRVYELIREILDTLNHHEETFHIVRRTLKGLTYDSGTQYFRTVEVGIGNKASPSKIHITNQHAQELEPLEIVDGILYKISQWCKTNYYQVVQPDHIHGSEYDFRLKMNLPCCFIREISLHSARLKELKDGEKLAFRCPNQSCEKEEIYFYIEDKLF